MKRKGSDKRRRYDAEFKSSILKMNRDGRSVLSLASSFGISEQLIARRRHPHHPAKLSIEIGEVVKSNLIANLGDRIIAFQEHFTGHAHPKFIQVFHKRFAGTFFKKATECRRAEVGLPCNIIQTNLL